MGGRGVESEGRWRLGGWEGGGGGGGAGQGLGGGGAGWSGRDSLTFRFYSISKC